jgi:hypothetical protein
VAEGENVRPVDVGFFEFLWRTTAVQRSILEDE